MQDIIINLYSSNYSFKSVLNVPSIDYETQSSIVPQHSKYTTSNDHYLGKLSPSIEEMKMKLDQSKVNYHITD